MRPMNERNGVIEPPDLEDWQTLVSWLRLQELAEKDRSGTENPELPPGLGGVWSALDGVLSFFARQRAFQRDPAGLGTHSALDCAGRSAQRICVAYVQATDTTQGQTSQRWRV
jgi:hypothetical protein